MEDEEPDSHCSICYERRENLRTLPCWHVACLTCILNMAETGQGRAMRCHECREPFLFENVRSLPQPLKCASCHHFLRSPKQLKCCSAIVCGDCATKYSGAERQELCPARCENSRTTSDYELNTPRICCQCFALHTNTMTGCDHSICSACESALTIRQRSCPLCLAVDDSTPLPIDPTGTNAVLNGPNDVTHDDGHPISQMHLISAVQTLQRWNQRRARQQNQPLGGLNYSVEQLKDDSRKVCAIGIAMVLAVLGWGATWWMWVVMTFYVIILRPTSVSTACLSGLIAIIFFLYLLFFHFILTICYVVMGMLSFGIQRLAAQATTLTVKSVVGWSSILTKLLLVWIFFPPIFFNNVIFDIAVIVSITVLQPQLANW